MTVEHIQISIGASEPFSVIHASDTHLTLADERDDARKTKLSQKRERNFPQALEMLKGMESLHKETGYMVVHTGDLIDFVSEANLDEARSFAQKVDLFLAAGNHEFSLYVGEAKEDAAYRNQSLDHVQQSFQNDIRFSSRVEHGVNFVAVDNSYYLFEPWQLEQLKEEVKKGYPVVLCLHTPLYCEALYNYLMEREGWDNPAYLMSVPEEKMSHYSPERYAQQKADDATNEAYAYILNEDRIKLILTGHVHCPFAFPLKDKMQYGVGCTDVRVIDFS